mmetsp:Transcript_13646/g.45496  ORF Transcript_13646/g.45496 Transcript_13646/m.45496 type:complete len:232 (-) Transcript_13646:213-908(-)
MVFPVQLRRQSHVHWPLRDRARRGKGLRRPCARLRQASQLPRPRRRAARGGGGRRAGRGSRRAGRPSDHAVGAGARRAADGADQRATCHARRFARAAADPRARWPRPRAVKVPRRFVVCRRRKVAGDGDGARPPRRFDWPLCYRSRSRAGVRRPREGTPRERPPKNAADGVRGAAARRRGARRAGAAEAREARGRCAVDGRRRCVDGRAHFTRRHRLHRRRAHLARRTRLQ